MTALNLSVVEPFTSPSWGSNFAVFFSDSGIPVAESETKEYISRACKYAHQHEVYLVPERFVLMGYHCMCLISPEGAVIGAQKCMHLHPGIQANKRSTGIEILPTEFGGVFLCVDVDIYRPEIVRVAHDMGAQILVCSQYIAPGDYNSGMVTTGAWNAAQSNPVFVINVTNQYNCVCAPRPLTKNNDGFVCAPNLKIPMSAKLSVEELAELPARHYLSRRFYAIHRRELL